VIARALKVAGNRLRLRMPPDSGGSFGVKQGVFPYLVLMGVAAQRHLPGFSARRCTNFRSSPRTTMSACAAPNPSRLSARRYRLH
jgi:hypothetical protein